MPVNDYRNSHYPIMLLVKLSFVKIVLLSRQSYDRCDALPQSELRFHFCLRRFHISAENESKATEILLLWSKAPPKHVTSGAADEAVLIFCRGTQYLPLTIVKMSIHKSLYWGLNKSSIYSSFSNKELYSI